MSVFPCFAIGRLPHGGVMAETTAFNGGTGTGSENDRLHFCTNPQSYFKPIFSGGCLSQSVAPLSRCLTETLGSYLPVDSTEFLKHPTLNACGEFLANRRPFDIDSLHEQNSHQVCSQPDAFAADVL